jgi:hypothetical protein
LVSQHGINAGISDLFASQSISHTSNRKFHKINCYIQFMKFQGPKIPDGEILTTDVCIIGAGPAGLAIAAEFAGGPYQVMVIESGAFPAETAGMRDETSAAFGHGVESWNFDQYQLLNLDDQQPTGDVSYPSAIQTHIRRFGGTSNSLRSGTGFQAAAGPSRSLSSIPTMRVHMHLLAEALVITLQKPGRLRDAHPIRWKTPAWKRGCSTLDQAVHS